MIKKIVIFIQSDGWNNTLKFIVNGVLGVLGRKSITLCLVCRRSDVKIHKLAHWSQFVSKTYKSLEDLENVRFPRLKYNPCRRWFDEGSVCRIVFKNDVPVAFSWTHGKKHNIDKVGTFDMGDSINWLGPYFVCKEYRGLSLQQLMIYQDILEAPESITSFITSVNQKNVASLHSFMKLGFFQGGSCTFLCGKTVIDIKDEASPYLKIK